MRRFLFSAAAILILETGTCFGEPFTIIDAINMAVRTNPGVSEAAANRRATETELRQNQSTLLPQVRLETRLGVEKRNQFAVTPPPLGNGELRSGHSHAVVVRQLLFDGFTSINEIWRQAARVDAAAARVHERTELIALDAAEAYVDVTRYIRLISLAQENLVAHRKILANVTARFSGGRAGEGDLEQAKERVAAAEAAAAEFVLSLDQAKAKFRKVVGNEPYNMRAPGRLAQMPPDKDAALAVALKSNPTIKAAQKDADAAKYAFHGTAGAFMPNVSLEGRAEKGDDASGFYGRYNDMSGKVVFSWDVFRGGQDSWRRAEMAERYMENTQRHARLQRDAFESLDKAWAARTDTTEKAAALRRQIESDRKVIAAYTKEYELGQRSLIDLLNANNQLFIGLVSLESTRSVAIFADFQLLAAMGQMLSYLKTALPTEAEPLAVRPFAIFPTKIPPVIISLPKPSKSEPLNVDEPARSTSLPSNPPTPVVFNGQDRVASQEAVASKAQSQTAFDNRWFDWSASGPTFSYLGLTKTDPSASETHTPIMSFAEQASKPDLLNLGRKPLN